MTVQPSFPANWRAVGTGLMAEVRDGRLSPGQQSLLEPMLMARLAVDP